MIEKGYCRLFFMVKVRKIIDLSFYIPVAEMTLKTMYLKSSWKEFSCLAIFMKETKPKCFVREMARLRHE